MQVGNAYSGAKLDAFYLRCTTGILISDPVALFPPFTVLGIARLAFLAGDLPISAMVDTLLVPIDRLIEKRPAPIHPLSDPCPTNNGAGGAPFGALGNASSPGSASRLASAAEQTNAVDDRERGSIDCCVVWRHHQVLRSGTGGAPARN
jgi:hypothetical protein